MLAFLAPLAGSVVKGIAGYFTKRQEIKQAKQNAELKVLAAKTEAKIALMANQQKADIAWEILSIEKSGWKDEMWTVIIAVPLVLCFIPGGASYVSQGFEALKAHTPEWYQGLVFIAVGAAFGVRKLTDFFKFAKGAK